MKELFRNALTNLSTKPFFTLISRERFLTLAISAGVSAFALNTNLFSTSLTDSKEETLLVSYVHTVYPHDSAFGGQLILKNSTDKPIKNWIVMLPMRANIDSIDNASFYHISDTAYAFTPTSANATIKAHDSITLQFSGIMSKRFVLPTAAFQRLTSLPVSSHTVHAPKGSEAPRNIALFSLPDDYAPSTELRLGEGRIYPIWEQSSDAVIPHNRKTWAMAMAHAHKLFTHVTKTPNVPISFYFATTLKESFCGCDPNIEVSQQRFPLVYQSKSQAQGCFQMEVATAYAELKTIYPDRFPDNGHDGIIANEHFETAALSKAHYDMFAIKYLDIAQGYELQRFFNTTNDSTAAMKTLALAYHQGLWSPLWQNVFAANRTKALQSSDISEFMGKEWRVIYNVKSLANFATLLNGQPKKLDKKLIGINPQTSMPYNMFYGFYDEQIAWTDVEDYLKKIRPMYRTQNWSIIKARLRKSFDAQNGGEAISFRYQFGQVLDQLILSLPESNPSRAIITKYGDKRLYADAGSRGRMAARK
ncbi:MAG: hypothetical protein RI894_1736 [Bacteroidota bacterium]|jgi:hypothetical protein